MLRSIIHCFDTEVDESDGWGLTDIEISTSIPLYIYINPTSRSTTLFRSSSPSLSSLPRVDLHYYYCLHPVIKNHNLAQLEHFGPSLSLHFDNIAPLYLYLKKKKKKFDVWFSLFHENKFLS